MNFAELCFMYVARYCIAFTSRLRWAGVPWFAVSISVADEDKSSLSRLIVLKRGRILGGQPLSPCQHKELVMATYLPSMEANGYQSNTVILHETEDE